MPPTPDERRESLRRFGYAIRSKPAEPAGEKRPGDLIAGTHSRGYLPHVKKPGSTYFVTFRLADSLPREVIVRLRAKSDAAARKPATNDISAAEIKRTAERDYFRDFEEALDSARGECWLRRAEIATLVADTLRHFDGVRYWLDAWVVMPNHVHAVLALQPGMTLSSVLHSWKSFTAKEANKMLPEKTTREFWQRESYDHICRDAEEITRCVVYVERNPVRARLCVKAEDWPWSSARGKRDACNTAGGDAGATPRAPL
jgi:REP element-mobilizing transposase RayT